MQYITKKLIETTGIIEINNPPRNLIDEPEFLDIDDLNGWIIKNSLKGVIIRGVGRNFSAGANKEKFYEKVITNKTMEGEFSRGRKILNFFESLTIPTLALIQGACFGAGLEIALSCHLRICSDNALIAFPESNYDLMPGFTGTYRLPRLIGKGKSLEIILSGEIIDPLKALAYGIVDYVKPKKEADDFALELLKKLTANRPLHVINAITKSINNYFLLDRDSALKEEAKLFCQLVRQKYHDEKT
ncbi:MAG: enoyl-CoA hydratase/isomerase family protein [Spirochaetales bacterium]|nr:enoyl-CoA hydratase/isomerase family protein [Spirochaetales bacterium]